MATGFRRFVTAGAFMAFGACRTARAAVPGALAVSRTDRDGETRIEVTGPLAGPAAGGRAAAFCLGAPGRLVTDVTVADPERSSFHDVVPSGPGLKTGFSRNSEGVLVLRVVAALDGGAPCTDASAREEGGRVVATARSSAATGPRPGRNVSPASPVAAEAAVVARGVGGVLEFPGRAEGTDVPVVLSVHFARRPSRLVVSAGGRFEYLLRRAGEGEYVLRFPDAVGVVRETAVRLADDADAVFDRAEWGPSEGGVAVKVWVKKGVMLGVTADDKGVVVTRARRP